MRGRRAEVNRASARSVRRASTPSPSLRSHRSHRPRLPAPRPPTTAGRGRPDLQRGERVPSVKVFKALGDVGRSPRAAQEHRGGERDRSSPRDAPVPGYTNPIENASNAIRRASPKGPRGPGHAPCKPCPSSRHPRKQGDMHESHFDFVQRSDDCRHVRLPGLHLQHDEGGQPAPVVAAPAPAPTVVVAQPPAAAPAPQPATTVITH